MTKCVCDPGIESDYFSLSNDDGGNLLDKHIDSQISEDEIKKRYTEAAEFAKRISKSGIPSFLEEELNLLFQPLIRWQDWLRQRLYKLNISSGKLDYMRPKNKQLFAGMYVPKKRQKHLRVVFLYDCSASMHTDEISFVVSQLKNLLDLAEVICVPFHTIVEWTHTTKVSKAEDLHKVKAVGRAATCISGFFEEYEKKIGQADCIVCATDGEIYDLDGIKGKPNCDTLWLINNHSRFEPPFGKVLHIQNEKL